MSTLETQPTSPPQVHRGERLSGEPVLDAQGRAAEPSAALPFQPTVPIPTMLVERELNYLHWLSSRLSGDGRVIELGCFLGGSTQALVAGKRRSDEDRPLISYDGFETTGGERESYVRWLASYGLAPGQRFREKFDQFNRSWMDELVVRDGWIEPDAGPDAERSIYPEQEPIELLFVDIAKAWGVNLSVLRAFGRHLLPGAVVVQQDFFDLQTPWIPLHMYQLRAVLEPLDVIHGTPSASFRCTGSLAPHLDGLWSEKDLRDAGVREQTWAEVRGYWTGLLGSDAAGFLSGHAAMHALQAGADDQAARYGREYEAWSRTKESDGVYFTPAWPDLLESLPGALRDQGRSWRSLTVLAAESIARGSRQDRLRPGERTAYCPKPLRRQIWMRAFDRLAAEGHRRVALLGAGQHTRWLLDVFGPDRVACILDDDPARDEIAGVPVFRPSGADASLRGATVVVPSSDSVEEQLLARAYELFGGRNDIEVGRVYTHPQASESVQPNWRYEVQPVAVQDRDAICRFAHSTPPIAESLDSRTAMGLPARRAWVETLRAGFRPPAWAADYLRMHETAFLWDMIEATRPGTIVEIGTASGVSTAMLLRGNELFCGGQARVCSFDIASHCYFDVHRRLGSAVGEMTPELAPRAEMYARANAADAASCFAQGEIDLLFIDAEHAHPAPVLDLLSLVYCLGPGSWVVLHDIELANIDPTRADDRWRHTGAARLYEQWPFEKTQLAGEESADRNIGAIRMPGRPEEAVEPLLGMLCPPFEMRGEPAGPARRAAKILAGSTFAR